MISQLWPFDLTATEQFGHFVCIFQDRLMNRSGSTDFRRHKPDDPLPTGFCVRPPTEAGRTHMKRSVAASLPSPASAGLCGEKIRESQRRALFLTSPRKRGEVKRRGNSSLHDDEL
jgi:hypothetical protein